MNLFIVLLILLNVLAVVLETVEPVGAAYAGFFHRFDQFSVAFFTLEYALRLWSVTVRPRFAHPVTGRLRYAATPMAVVDLVAILPFYLPALGLDLRVVRSLRLLRVFRLLKLTRYSRSLQTLAAVLRDKKDDLAVVLYVLVILLVLVSSLMYYAEHEAQPNAFSSIPATMWWGVVTLTTVGYGDVFPVTPVGKVLGALTAILGIGMFALPAGLLATGLIEELHRQRGADRARAGGGAARCPHCGKAIAEG